MTATRRSTCHCAICEGRAGNEESRKQRHEVEEREALSENVSESLLTRVVEELIDAACAEWDKEQLCKQHWGELLTGGQSVS